MFSPRIAVLGLSILLAAPVLAGCVGDGEPPGEPARGAARDLAVDVTALAHSGAEAVAYVEKFAMTYPNRYGNTPAHDAARDYLAGELSTQGLEVVRQPYDTGVNVLGFKRGIENPAEWIVLSAHYDTDEQTVYGAWDDGAGSAAVLEMARAFAGAPWGRTLVFALFDGEERGLLGSKAFVTNVTARDDVAVVANLNFDPPGLNWPCVNPDGSPMPVTVLHSNASTPPQEAIKAAVLAARESVGIPDEAWAFRDGGVALARVNGVGPGGTSDHVSFDRVGIANLFIGGDARYEVGPAAVMTYSLHSPIDTLQQMEARCGGAALLEGGFQTVLDLTAHTLANLERVPSANLAPVE